MSMYSLAMRNSVVHAEITVLIEKFQAVGIQGLIGDKYSQYIVTLRNETSNVVSHQDILKVLVASTVKEGLHGRVVV